MTNASDHVVAPPHPHIVVEWVSPSERRFFSRDPFMTCATHNFQVEMRVDELNDEIRDMDERDPQYKEAHAELHRLLDSDCPVAATVVSFDTSDERNVLMSVSHCHQGMIQIIVNLAAASDAIDGLIDKVIQVICAEQGWKEKVYVKYVGAPHNVTDTIAS